MKLLNDEQLTKVCILSGIDLGLATSKQLNILSSETKLFLEAEQYVNRNFSSTSAKELFENWINTITTILYILNVNNKIGREQIYNILINACVSNT